MKTKEYYNKQIMLFSFLGAAMCLLGLIGVFLPVKTVSADFYYMHLEETMTGSGIIKNWFQNFRFSDYKKQYGDTATKEFMKHLFGAGSGGWQIALCGVFIIFVIERLFWKRRIQEHDQIVTTNVKPIKGAKIIGPTITLMIEIGILLLCLGPGENVSPEIGFWFQLIALLGFGVTDHLAQLSVSKMKELETSESAEVPEEIL